MAAQGKGRGPTPKKRRPAATEDGTAVEGGRYTAPTPKYRVRPRWHRVAGWFGVIVGIAVIVANDGMLIVEDVRLLPFGHQEFYLILGLLIAGASTWFLGLFDRGTTVFD